jgi:hypothetical protein
LKSKGPKKTLASFLKQPLPTIRSLPKKIPD